jgi:hypothetical protein
MTEVQIALLTGNIFLAAYLGKHWLNALFFIFYTFSALLK